MVFRAGKSAVLFRVFAAGSKNAARRHRFRRVVELSPPASVYYFSTFDDSLTLRSSMPIFWGTRAHWDCSMDYPIVVIS